MRPFATLRSRNLSAAQRAAMAGSIVHPGEMLANIRAMGVNPDAFFRANSPLPKHAEEVLDGAISKVGRAKLTVVADLIDRGLTVALPGWMGIPVYTTSMSGEAGRAKRTQTLTNVRGERQMLDIANLSIPTYITWDDYNLDPRFLATAERVNYPVETTHAEQAARNVNESLEDTVINGFVDEDGTLVKVYDTETRGLLNAANGNTFTFETNTPWDDAGKTGAEILADIRGMIALLKANHFDGPFLGYYSTNYEDVFTLDYTTGYPKTIAQRIAEGFPALTLKVADFLPDDTVVIFQATSDVIDLVIGQLPTSASWLANPGQPMSSISSVVWAVVIPRVKYDYNGNSGIVVGTPT